uniref:Tropomodulin n=1 Tax=Timema shepardi TaxID=629360 RepID=A0A7R9B1W3_TIMSH|nr:unnamed protein product [Timema shepardi]
MCGVVLQDQFLPPSQRTSYDCEKTPTGPLDRKKLIEHINKQAMETPDIPEHKPYVAGTVRGKKVSGELWDLFNHVATCRTWDLVVQKLGTQQMNTALIQSLVCPISGPQGPKRDTWINKLPPPSDWIPPPQSARERNADEQIAIDLGDEYETALTDASQEEIIDLAAILGFHSMMNQDQYHASLLNKGQPVGLGWDGITKASQPKLYPVDPPNSTDPDATIKQVKDDDHNLTDLNWNNIKNISDEKFTQLFEALPENTHLETLSLTNTGMTDPLALKLAEVLERNTTLRVVNVETNFISPLVIVRLIKSLLATTTIEEFRASNQVNLRCSVSPDCRRSTVLGNKIEMEITSLVEQNPTLLRLGLHLEYNDARHRIAMHLQRNIDRTVELNTTSALANYATEADRLRRMGRASRNYTIGFVNHRKSLIVGM